ncbi:hypothetical protein LY90DRAFT_395319 [Neocallimastix californiae]|uniref:Uncharacterized protein n=1 Tax=Neocallimastix californiae TaxID=1754190 RepID=A0A1Y2FMP7_9FUNG|nr:hypothetical protein LY90DRAFT_395319 [Neocallimastix californiae]|eukprot:ORY85261.1 hypothetical protein LY90DRAFT_395319 [Neocallimastix californiae]
MYSKEAEFRSWLIEVKNISFESLPTSGIKQYFAEYMEDYNTATLPHIKYYNLEKYEMEERKKNNPFSGYEESSGVTDILQDEKRHRQLNKSKRATAASLMMTEDQLKDLKKIYDERVAADRLKKMGYEPKSSMGIRYEMQI